MNKAIANVYIWVLVISTILIWALVLTCFGIELAISGEAIKKLPLVVTIEVGLLGLFIKWGWKLRVLPSWLIVEPIIEGTWKGVLKSTWVDPITGEIPEDIPIILSIKQEFFNISCSMFTEESPSHSYAARIIIDEASGMKRLIYNYTNKPKASVRDRSEFHDGTVNLVIIGGRQNELAGEYWTTRKTTGEMKLNFHSNELVSSFGKAT
ncbi:MAG: hypothetical protein COB45_05200 [Gammaproteobacteria bacterium]|jgi:hypothetical protein|nr:MAG: hypothetical protein COB45_05200 [Gammaproteobacteria bacterium]PHR83566.1 MAG: hypothetical protein COA59_10725 [Colwellia sp.]